MQKLRLAIVGCGGMGGRHLFGLQELQSSGVGNVELVAVCDLRREHAEYLAQRAEELLGQRPRVFTDLATMATSLPDLHAVDITTDSGTHHRVATAALDLGLNVMLEKPLALTLRGCNQVIAAWQRSGKVLSVAEQFRRDPMHRLIRAVIEKGVIGQPTMTFDLSVGGGNRLIILPWRHDKFTGGILLDAGVHNADVMQYLLGNVREAYARIKLYEPLRYKAEARSAVTPFYERFYPEVPDAIPATAEDAMFATLTFESGVLGQWTAVTAAHGEGFSRQMIYGTNGSIRVGGARNGIGPVLQVNGVGEVKGEELLKLVPDFHLSPMAARLFGSDRLASYGYTFPEADRKLLAVEYHELAACVLEGAQPEVNAFTARKAVALVYAALESGTLNRPVTLAEVEEEKVSAYQDEINARVRL